MKRLLASLATCIALVSNSALAGDDAARMLHYTTTWIGNTFGGGPKWVQNFAEEHPVRRLAHFLDGGQQQANQYGDNGYDYKQFNQGECSGGHPA